MIIESLVEKNELTPHFKNEILENSAKVDIDESFYNEGVLKTDEILNISVDGYYNSLKLPVTPCSIDNLVLVKRGINKYSIYLIELKDVSKLKRLCSENIKSKFDTTLNDFMMTKYQQEFGSDQLKIIDFNLWLVCNRFNFMKHDITQEQYQNKIQNTFLETLMLLKPYRYKGKISRIQAMYPGAEIC
ncbi:TPA: hypothetical protein ACN30P_003218 [Vibrio parahaemolyticus]|nr:hypothetical protein [Vibrio parahaemolyticus]